MMIHGLFHTGTSLLLVVSSRSFDCGASITIPHLTNAVILRYDQRQISVR